MMVWKSGGSVWCSFVHLFVVCLVDSLTFGSRVYADGLWH